MGGGSGFLIQVAAYKDEAIAKSTAAEIKTKAGDLLSGASENIQRADLGDKGVYYRVQFGPFASRGAANEHCGGLKSLGVNCIVVAPAHS
jgi:cell division protein FtsN